MINGDCGETMWNFMRDVTEPFQNTSLSFKVSYIIIKQVILTSVSPQVLSSSSAWVPAFRGRRLWCTPTIPQKDSRSNGTNFVFQHGTTQREGRTTLISSALWTSRSLGPMNITLDMGETLGANELQAMFHISNSCVLLIFFLLQAAQSVVIRS